jgi:hypothetical protein
MKEWVRNFLKDFSYWGSGVFILFFIVSDLVIYGKNVFFHPVFGFIILAGSIWLAFVFKDDKSIKWVIIFPVILIAIFIIDSNSPYKPFIEKYFFNGGLVTTRVFVDETTDNEGVYYPAHYDTNQQFKITDNKSETEFKIVDNALNLLALGLIALAYFILNNWNLKFKD